MRWIPGETSTHEEHLLDEATGEILATIAEDGALATYSYRRFSSLDAARRAAEKDHAKGLVVVREDPDRPQEPEFPDTTVAQ